MFKISLNGIHIPNEKNIEFQNIFDRKIIENNDLSVKYNEKILHPKYKIPARCFAYVGHPEKTSTWKLPYLVHDGRVDIKRLPKAIQALLSNYRGKKISSIPDEAIPRTLKKLFKAAELEGKVPTSKNLNCAEIYKDLENVMDQLNR